jgi:hypothetical protein
MWLLFVVSIIYAVVQGVKDFFTPAVPDEYCNHMELYYKDIVDGVPLEQCMKNLENGKYK